MNDERVKVFKNNVECGWFKSTWSGVPAVIATCKQHRFDITQYHITEFNNTENIVWRGEKSMVENV